jgi:hypothetical protein
MNQWQLMFFLRRIYTVYGGPANSGEDKDKRETSLNIAPTVCFAEVK